MAAEPARQITENVEVGAGPALMRAAELSAAKRPKLVYVSRGSNISQGAQHAAGNMVVKSMRVHPLAAQLDNFCCSNSSATAETKNKGRKNSGQ